MDDFVPSNFTDIDSLDTPWNLTTNIDTVMASKIGSFVKDLSRVWTPLYCFVVFQTAIVSDIRPDIVQIDQNDRF